MNKHTAIYMRVSTEDQRLDSQETELKRHCGLRGWNDTKVYTDTISGATGSRPDLDRLVQDMRAGKVERLVCYKLDRLGRSLTHLALILEEMQRLRVPLICTTQGIDTSDDNPAGRLQLGVLMAVAEFERSMIRDRTRAGLVAAKERGRKLGRPATLSKRASEVSALKKRGMGVRAIARELRMPPSSVHSVLGKVVRAEARAEPHKLIHRRPRLSAVN